MVASAERPASAQFAPHLPLTGEDLGADASMANLGNCAGYPSFMSRFSRLTP